MRVQDKIDKELKELGALEFEKVVIKIMEYYEMLNLEFLSTTIKKEKDKCILTDIYNEKNYTGKTLKECYIALFESLLEEVYEKELQAELEKEEAINRKLMNKTYWDKQLKVTA